MAGFLGEGKGHTVHGLAGRSWPFVFVGLIGKRSRKSQAAGVDSQTASDRGVAGGLVQGVGGGWVSETPPYAGIERASLQS